MSQEITLRGTVISAVDKLPLPGVSVVVKNTTIGTITDASGRFSLDVPKGADVLVFSFIGMHSQEILIDGKGTFNVALNEKSEQMDEVVVVGYGTVKKSDLTGSVGTVRGEALVKAPTATFTEALAGRMAGVRISTTDGQPGSTMNITIRGAGSLTQSTSPLYVIDGFPSEDIDPADINPEEVESITILKDASATAIYGSRGANGVVVVETKRGMVSKPVITFNSTHGFQQVQKKMDVMNPYEFVKYQNELNPTFAEMHYFQNDRTLDYYKDMEGLSWQDEIFRNSPVMNYNISIRGGTPETKYSLSGSVYNMEGIVINTGFDRYQGRISIDQKISGKIKVGVTANYSKKKTFGQQVAVNPLSSFTSYLLSRAWGYRPVSGKADFDLLEEDYDPELMDQYNYRANPLTTSVNDYSYDFSNDLFVNGYIQYSILKNLTLDVRAGFIKRELRRERFYNSKTPQGSLLNMFNTKGVNGYVRYTDSESWSNENILTYKKTFSQKHQITMVVGGSMQDSKYNTYGYAAMNIPNEELGMKGLDEGIPYLGYASDGANGMVSFFGRADYNYNSKYMLTATFRGDASSKFAPGNKWGYFPSAAFAWNMQKENFMKEISFVSNSKLRLSYGVTGNNRISDYAYYSQLSMPINSSYSFNNATPDAGIIPNNLANKGLKWESTEQINIGYDLGLFKNRIGLTVDWYRKLTQDLLLNADISAISGFTSMYQNVGEIKNNGIELSVNTINVQNKSFSWRSNFNISFNRNEVLELARGQEALYTKVSFESQYNGSPLYISQVGHPAGMFYGYVFDGIYQYDDFDNPAADTYILKNNVPTNGNNREAIQPGDIKYKDINSDGVVDSYDMVVIGNGQPIHTGGFSNTFAYKGFSLDMLLEWSYGNEIYNANRLMFEGNGNIRSDLNQYASYEDRWTPENPSEKYFRTGGQGPIGYHSSRVLEDGSYLRLKTVSLGYSIPAQYIKRLYLTKLELSISAQNLVTWTKYTGMDPEVSVRNSVLTPGFDFSAYPIPRTVVLGINVAF
ncbi:SusC/RagA family TonB-linked outer membrane protein [Mariniphaga sediminis]|uniref:SusC/RagA family TonB-linked outer membrane protein n=1 Tax=Mariniphaga sediminis TaxID=1628158 RepID=UPI0035613468